MMSMTSRLEHVMMALSSVSTGPGASFAPPSMTWVRPGGPASNARPPRHVASLRVMTGVDDPVVRGRSPIEPDWDAGGAGGGSWCADMTVDGVSALDRGADGVAPLGPAAVVVAHAVVAEEIAQHEPGVARALADAAVGD